MTTYRIYEQAGENTRHTTGTLCEIEAETAADALRQYGMLDSCIELNDADDAAWREYPDHDDRLGLEHLLCADVQTKDN